MLKIFFKILTVINQIIPKSEKTIVLYANLGFRDNVGAIFQYLIDNGYNDKYKIVCVSNNFYSINRKVNNVKFVNLYHGIFYFLSSKYFFYCFGKYPIKPGKNQIVVNLWHGMPIKKVGNLEPENVDKDYNFFTFLTASSSMFSKILQKGFRANDDQMIICGSPRNYYLGKPTRLFKEKKEIVWMPTYKESRDVKTKGLIFNISKENWYMLDATLKINDVRLIIKLHPLETTHINEMPSEMKNISFINDLDLSNRNIQLYSFIGGMDALITDYSSVCFDYLLMDRPIAFTVDDFENYQRDRGFIFTESMLDELMPGDRIFQFEELLNFCVDVANSQDEYSTKRYNANMMVNEGSHVEDFCKKILNEVGICR